MNVEASRLRKAMRDCPTPILSPTDCIEHCLSQFGENVAVAWSGGRCSTAVQAKVLSHSEKPEVFRRLIEKATRHMKPHRRLELFARKRVKGWTAWGLEI